MLRTDTEGVRYCVEEINARYTDGSRHSVCFTCKSTKGGRVHVGFGRLDLNNKGVLQVSNYEMIGGSECGSVVTPTIRMTGRHIITCPHCLAKLENFLVELDEINKGVRTEILFTGKDRCDICGEYKPRLELSFNVLEGKWYCLRCAEAAERHSD